MKIFFKPIMTSALLSDDQKMPTLDSFWYMTSQIWLKGADQNFGPFLPTGPALLNFIKILSLFNTKPNRPRASQAIFKHVGQVHYSRGFKFGEKGPIKILAHFCLQVRR